MLDVFPVHMGEDPENSGKPPAHKIPSQVITWRGIMTFSAEEA